MEQDWLRPKVERRLLVPNTIKLSSLHDALMWGTVWQGGHLHEFIFADANYGRIEPEWDLAEGELDEAPVTLQEALGSRKMSVAPGYEEFLAALADPTNPEHEELQDWIGSSFDQLLVPDRLFAQYGSP